MNQASALVIRITPFADVTIRYYEKLNISLLKRTKHDICIENCRK